MTPIPAIMSRIITSTKGYGICCAYKQPIKMKEILAFSGSMSADSINPKLVNHAAGFAKSCNVNVIRLLDFEAPLYSKEREAESGIPESIRN